jgi:hypothetical protein
MISQILKQAWKRTWRPQGVVRAADGGVAGGATVGVASTGGLKMVFPRSVPLNM